MHVKGRNMQRTEIRKGADRGVAKAKALRLDMFRQAQETEKQPSWLDPRGQMSKQ